MEVFEDLLREASADVADCLVHVGRRVVAGQQECTINRCSFALAIVSAQDNQVKGVANAREIVLFNLLPGISWS